MYNTETLILLILIGLFIIGREFFCWYFKINERIKLEKERNDLLKKLASHCNSDVMQKEEFKIEPDDIPEEQGKKQGNHE